MAAHRVIQDSDGSDDELGDLTAPKTSLDELSKTTDAGHMALEFNPAPDPCAQIGVDNFHDATRTGAESSLNRDEPLFLESQPAGSSNSQKEREPRNSDGCGWHEPDRCKGSIVGVDEWPSFQITQLKRGRSMGAFDGIHTVDRPQIKRRKTSIDDIWSPDHSSGPQHHSLETITRDSLPINPSLALPSLSENGFQPESVSEQYLKEQTYNPTEEDNEYLRSILASCSSRPSPHRSKSMPMATNSPNDTEPMSSTTFARAQRTLTVHEALPPDSPTNSHDELALPVSVQIPLAKLQGADTNVLPHNSEGICDQDQLASDDFGGMPKEMYNPRPSRSRAKTDESPIAPPQIDAHDNTEKADSRELASHISESTEAKAWQSEEVNILEKLSEDHGTPKPSKLKAPREKKMKRGKTTSAIIERATNFDVEDDVIWVDEKPAARLRETIQLPEPLHTGLSKTGDHPNDTSAEVAAIQANEPVLAPKKRGRKPKKKPDPVSVEITKHITVNDNENLDKPQQTLTEGPVRDSLTPLQDLNAPEVIISNISIPITEPVGIERTIETPEPFAAPQTTLNVLNETNADKENEQPPQRPSNEDHPVATPKKPVEKGPDKHSPIAVNKGASYRVGLSRKARIAPLLKVIRK